jgi:Eukaryotic initiation factor 4E
MVAALSTRLRKMYPLVHSWEFWHDRSNREKALDPKATVEASATSSSTKSDDTYEERLVKLLDITDVQHFWELYNNFPVDKMLRLRDSVHLFKKGVKPLWEDPRNVRGGAWTFRVPKEQAPEFWKHICLAAIGEALQSAVYDESRKSMSNECFIRNAIY